ncbi:MAG: tetratricopeptide repeat protein [Terriglobales bacterium]
MKTKAITTVGMVGALALAALLAGCARHPQQAAQALLTEARQYHRQGKDKAAVIEIRRALQVEPGSIAAYRMLADVELGQQQWAEAYAALREIVNLDPSRAPAWLDLGRLYVRNREWTQAHQAAETVLHLDPNNPAAHQILATVDAAQQDAAGAERELTLVTQLRPRDPDAWINLALAQAGQRQTAAATQSLRTATAVNPQATLAWADWGQLLQSEHDAAAAESVLRQGLAANPRSTSLWLAQASLDENAGRTAQANQDIATLWQRRHDAAAALAAGEFYGRRGDWTSAVRVEQAGLPLQPPDVALREQLLTAYLHTRQWQQADDLAGALLHLHPGDVPAQLAQARVRIARGQAGQTLPALEALAQEHAGEAPVLYTLGLAQWHAGRVAESIQSLDAASAADPHCAPCLELLARLWMQQGSPTTGRNYTARLRKLGVSPAAADRLLGEADLQAGQAQAALQQFQSAGLAHSSLAEDHVLLAQAAEAAGQLAMAQQQYQRALARQTAWSARSTDLLGHLVHVEAARGQWPAAESAIAHFQSAHPKDAAGPWLEATVAMARGRTPVARTELHRALHLQPDFVEAEIELGRLNQQSGDWQRAASWYEQALKQEPTFAPLLAVVGNLYLQQGQLPQAEQYYRQALAAQPGFVLAEANLAWCEAATHQNLNAALALAQKAARAAPEMVSVQDTLGWVYYKLGSYQSALPILQHCVAASPRSSEYHFHLGMTQLAAGETSAGTAELRQALALHLASPEAQAARAALRHARA